MIFAWDDANRDHIAKHGVDPAEAEFVIEHATSPFPQDVGDDSAASGVQRTRAASYRSFTF